MSVEPSAGRATVEDLGTTLRITIPSRKQWFVLVFLTLWLVGWLFGEIMGARILSQTLLPAQRAPSSGASGGFTGLWLLLWTFGGCWAIYNVVWQLAGKEVVDVGSDGISIRRTALGLGGPSVYTSQYIGRLRLDWTRGEEPARSGWRWSWQWGQQPHNRGWLAFDYGVRTIHFADSLDEAEARQILKTIDNRFPAYRGADEKEATP